MKIFTSLAISFYLFAALAEDKNDSGKASSDAEKKKDGCSAEKKADTAPVKPEEDKTRESRGDFSAGGKTFCYVAKTGAMPVLKDDGSVRANIFYVYYALCDADGNRLSSGTASARPLMFCFNGGPGASSVWLHLGGLGPERVDLPDISSSSPPVAATADNPNSVLDHADLVFVDPVSTGLSRAASGEKPETFHGIGEDIESLGEFVRLFTTREKRWASPKFLCGESYGAMRVAGLADYLQDRHGMYLNGLILVSGLLNFQTILGEDSNDLPYILFLPNYTAVAQYHGKLSGALQNDLQKAIEDSRRFARNEYALALLEGNAISEKKKAEISSELSRLTGIDKETIARHNLRLEPSAFRKLLLEKEKKILGRFDARILCEDSAPWTSEPDMDPSLAFVSGAFSSAVNGYVRGVLGYESDHPYRLLVGLPWRWSGFEGRFVSTEKKLADAMNSNPSLRVLVISGRSDLAVPGDSMEYSISHMNLGSAAMSRISFASFASGHMMYLCPADAEKLRAEIGSFIRQASPGLPAAP